MLHRFWESHGRSILKAFSWKLIASVISFSVLYYEKRDVMQSLKFSATVFCIGIVAYYIHERLWNGVHWGKQHLPSDHH
jgi:uncharacterized membrane protein